MMRVRPELVVFFLQHRGALVLAWELRCESCSIMDAGGKG